MDKIPITLNISTERSSSSNIISHNNLFLSDPILCNVLNTVHDVILILNHERQIIFANQTAKNLITDEDLGLILGMRTGDLLNCEHSIETGGGCGTTESCKMCGFFIATLNCQKGTADVQECRITQKGSMEALDLRVYTSPLALYGNNFTVLTVTDISHEKRRRILEKIFLHDIVNTALCLQGAAQIINEPKNDDKQYFKNMIVNLSDSLLEEIVAQRDIAAAESSELKVMPVNFNILELLKDLIGFYSLQEQWATNVIQVDPDSSDVQIHSDRILMRRVLSNLIKNALEASKKGGTVTVGCKLHNTFIDFWIHNDNFIPRNYQLQIFQRSFTTKGVGRGIGTYSIKLLGEKYLKGKVSFTSTEKDGTSFFASFPVKFAVDD
jgi:nitrogen-specific signal transduction histidine kinase